jgi:hypothetical protein
MAEVEAFESDAYYDSKPEPKRGRRINDMESIATVATTKLQPGEPNEP